MFIVELYTRDGRLCESYATYEEACRRVEQFPAEALVGMPMIFQELPDGSERLVREDGKPLQWHRLNGDHEAGAADTPVPLADESSGLIGDGRWVFREYHLPQEDGEGDLPLDES